MIMKARAFAVRKGELALEGGSLGSYVGPMCTLRVNVKKHWELTR